MRKQSSFVFVEEPQFKFKFPVVLPNVTQVETLYTQTHTVWWWTRVISKIWTTNCDDEKSGKEVRFVGALEILIKLIDCTLRLNSLQQPLTDTSWGKNYALIKIQIMDGAQ